MFRVRNLGGLKAHFGLGIFKLILKGKQKKKNYFILKDLVWVTSWDFPNHWVMRRAVERDHLTFEIMKT